MTTPRATFYEVQSRNRAHTFFLLFAFLVVFAVVGLGADWYFLGFPSDGPPLFTVCALVVAGATSAWSYFLGAREVLGATRARQASAANPEQRTLVNVVEEMSIASGLPPPPVYVIPDEDPNAFAVGRDPEHAALAVTQGLLTALDRDELQSVVAHEMAHVRNLDIRTMTLVAALYGGLVLISDWASHGFRFGRGVAHGRGRSSGSNRDRGGGAAVFFLLWLALVIVAPLVGRLLALSVSRTREFDADATSAELTRNPGALASALRKIHAATSPTRSIGRGAAHLCIADPTGSAPKRETVYGGLFDTHPPIHVRIALLEAMAGASGAPESAAPGPPLPAAAASSPTNGRGPGSPAAA